MNKIKQWLKSKTINFGLLLQIAASIQIYADTLERAALTAAIGVIIIILRFKTNQALEDK